MGHFVNYQKNTCENCDVSCEGCKEFNNFCLECADGYEYGKENIKICKEIKKKKLSKFALVIIILVAVFIFCLNMYIISR